MPNQDPLIDPSRNNLPGPQFNSRPGWGGQLGSWLSRNSGKLIVRIVVLVLVIWGISALFSSNDSNLAASPTPTPSSNADANGAYSQTAGSGEGLSHLAARALDAYLTDHSDIKLAPIEHTWAINRLTNTMLSISSRQIPASPKAGEVVDFPEKAIESAIADARALTPAQRQNLQKSLR